MTRDKLQEHLEAIPTERLIEMGQAALADLLNQRHSLHVPAQPNDPDILLSHIMSRLERLATRNE